MKKVLFVILIIAIFFINGCVKEVDYSKCSSPYTVSCYSIETEDITTIKENIPCSSNNDCSIENMAFYCQPGDPSLLLCANAKYYCGKDGYCKGCDCSVRLQRFI